MALQKIKEIFNKKNAELIIVDVVNNQLIFNIYHRSGKLLSSLPDDKDIEFAFMYPEYKPDEGKTGYLIEGDGKLGLKMCCQFSKEAVTYIKKERKLAKHTPGKCNIIAWEVSGSNSNYDPSMDHYINK